MKVFGFHAAGCNADKKLFLSEEALLEHERERILKRGITATLEVIPNNKRSDEPGTKSVILKFPLVRANEYFGTILTYEIIDGELITDVEKSVKNISHDVGESLLRRYGEFRGGLNGVAEYYTLIRDNVRAILVSR